ncbi:hypothetical protein, variant 1 [Aphanomyces invadans]|uniref:Uncharacterized protein n=2 Tax=Aphanomyces invadans TaxID=157072 RepID=A0A024UC56_9STRA|nr:hypothetical protein, variant 1 [Aphanomyces invadans]ETW03849.1 hypothetical protein, variant 1 [Aphanomyces invadans]|eukprot:XP_008868078.1 hypothetical protein, variant 1 [Aphanomyces invadans]
MMSSQFRICIRIRKILHGCVNANMAELATLARGDPAGAAWHSSLQAFCGKYGGTRVQQLAPHENVPQGASSFDWDRSAKRAAVTNVWSQLQKQAEDSSDTLLSLTVVKIFMRDRMHIDVLLSLEALELFVRLAEHAADEPAALEAIKCAINSVIARPAFVAAVLATPTYDHIFHLTTLARPFEFHTLVWKLLLATFEHPAAIERVERTLHGYACVLPTLAYCMQPTELFLKDVDRIALATELLKVLYVFASTWQNATHLPPDIDSTADSAMALLSSTLALPNTQSVLDFKLQAANVLLIVQYPALVDRFVAHDGVKHAVAFVEYAIMKVRVEKTQEPSIVTPLVIGLHQLAKNNAHGFETLKRAIFAGRAPGDSTSLAVANAPPLTHAKPNLPLSQLPMSPPSLVKGSLHESMCAFMTSTNTDLKRCVSEFLFTLCHNNALEFTHCTGLGNAVALLRLKGIM